MLIAFLGIVAFLCVAVGAWSLRTLVVPDNSMRDRVARVTRGSNAPAKTSLFGQDETTPSMRFRFAEIAAPSTDEERNLLRQKLIQGGFRSATNLEQYLSLRAASALIPPLVCLGLVGTMKLEAMLVLLLGTASLGYYLPAVLLDWRIRTRQAAILRPFPDTLDLLVCCVEAGLGLDAAFRRVAEEMEPAAPLLSQELNTVNHEIAAGVPRADALRRLDKRTGLSEMGSLVSVLVQADRFGTSIAQALRTHAELVRTRRMLAAEEKAAQISPKLTVVMILFILPSLMMVLVGPAILNIAKNLLPTLSGGGG